MEMAGYVHLTDSPSQACAKPLLFPQSRPMKIRDQKWSEYVRMLLTHTTGSSSQADKMNHPHRWASSSLQN